jgi:drug/metabolite transporter (DMT)-like permease
VQALALGLLLAAALLHVAWNLLFKRASDRALVMWWTLVAGAVLWLPIVALRGSLDARGWGFALLSALAEAAYYALLIRSYRHDFSLVYPVARGVAPVFLVAWAALLLRETPSVAGGAGIALVAGGVMAAGLRGGARVTAVPLAIAVGFMTSLYTLVDGVAVRTQDPLVYNGAIYALSALLLAPLALRRGSGALRVLRSDFRTIAAAGVFSYACYALVLTAYRLAPLAYAAAVREVSVVIGAVAGWLWLGEPFGPRRVAGAVIVFAGIAVIALAR